MRKKRRWRTGLVILCVVLLYGCFSLGISKYGLSVSYDTIFTEENKEPVRILQLTDLHNSRFGENNKRLIEKVRSLSPDLILITGDLLDSGEEDLSVSVNVLNGMKDIAPIYVSLGNHEMEYEEMYGVCVTEIYEETGATVLEYSYEDIVINGQTLRIGGIYGYCLPEKYLETREADREECDFLNDFMDTEAYTILLCHMPYAWLELDALNEWDVDCVFSGHVHGGQIRFPLLGGLWAPDQGWFPGKEAGVYSSRDGSRVLILSRGLGSTEKIPRFNNVPEINVVDIMPGKDE